MKIHALQDCLFVKPDKEEHEIFQMVGNKPMGTGLVLKAGSNVKHVKEGDRIMFGESVGQYIQYDNRDFLVMREEHILGVYE